MNLPDMFTFIHYDLDRTLLYEARKYGNDYQITWNSDQYPCLKPVIYVPSTVQRYVDDGIWIITSTVCVEEESDLEIGSIL